MFETKSVSTAQLTKRMFSNASLYGVGMIFLRFGNLLVLPFLWGKLTPADFGLIAGAQILIQFLGPLIDLGISSIIQRLFFEWEESARGKHLAALFVVTLISSFTICCLLDLFGPYLASLVFESIPFEIFRVAIWTVFFSNLAVTPLAIMRAQEQIKLYTVVNTASFLIQITLICIFVFVFDWGAVGYLLGTLTSAALLSFYYLFFVSRYLSFPFKVSDLKEPMKYGLPLVPGTALEGANAVLDRYFLEHVVSLASLGLYNLARQFSGAFNMFLVILKTSWIPLIYKITSERDDSPKILAEMSIFYFASFFFPASGFIGTRWQGFRSRFE